MEIYLNKSNKSPRGKINLGRGHIRLSGERMPVRTTSTNPPLTRSLASETVKYQFIYKKEQTHKRKKKTFLALIAFRQDARDCDKYRLQKHSLVNIIAAQNLLHSLRPHWL